MLLRSVIAAAALALAQAAAAQTLAMPEASAAPGAPLDPEADAIFSLRNVESLAFDSARDGLFAIADGKLMQWSLFPLELKAGIALDTLASDLALSPGGNLFVAGQRWDQKSLLLLGGSIMAFPVDPETGIEDWVRLYQVAGNSVGISQFSSVAFDRSGRAYFGSPVAFTVLVVPDDLSTPEAGTTRGTLDLRCGASSQLSVFEASDQVYYFSSTIEGAAVEFGAIADGAERKGGAECFRVANIYSQKAAPATFYSVRHAIVSRAPDEEDGARPWHALIALEPNMDRLYVFEVGIADGDLMISRNRSAEVDLRALEPATRVAGTGTYGLLAASGDGSEIYVSGSSMRHVLRFGLSPTEGLVPRGRFDLGAPVQGMEISADGRYAALVTGENRFGAERVITLVRNPGALRDGDALPASYQSIRVVQDLLNASGFDAGRVDGIFGPRTVEAIDAYIESVGSLDGPLDGASDMPSGADLGPGRSLPGDETLRTVIKGIFPEKVPD